MHKPLATVLFFLITTTPLLAQQNAKQLIEDLKPALTSQTIAVLNIDLNNFEPSSLFQKLVTEEAYDKRQIDLTSKNFDNVFRLVREAGGIDLTFLYKVGTLIPENRLLIVRCKDGSQEKIVTVLKNQVDGFFGLYPKVTIHKNLVLLCRSEHGRPNWAVEIEKQSAWLDLHDQKTTDAYADKLGGMMGPIRMVLLPTADQKKALVELDPKSFADGKAGSSASIEHLEYVALDVSKRRVIFEIKTMNNEAHKAVADKTFKTIHAFTNLREVTNNLPKFAGWLQGIGNHFVSPKKNLWQVNLKGKSYEKAMAAISGPILKSLRHHRYSASIGKIRQIVIALHNYYDVNGKMPPAYSVDKDGNRLLSWRVLILPYLNQGVLFKKFKLDEPWDSKHNRQLAGTIPAIYLNRSDRQDESGELKTRFVGMGKGGVLSPDAVTFGEITDGSSNTIAIAEATPESAVIWTKPQDVEIDDKDLKNKLIEDNGIGFWTGFADGSVQFIPSRIEPGMLDHLCRINDGNLVDQRSLENPVPASPDFDPIEQLPEFWFNRLMPMTWMIGGAGN